MSLESAARRREYARRRLRALYAEQRGCCYWCPAACLLPEDAGYYRSSKRKQPNSRLSGRAATLDHLYSRLHPLRTRKGIRKRLVMACFTCNHKRAAVEQAVLVRDGKLEERLYTPFEPGLASKHQRRAVFTVAAQEEET